MTAPRDILGRKPVFKPADDNTDLHINQSDDWKGVALIKATRRSPNDSDIILKSFRKYG